MSEPPAEAVRVEDVTVRFDDNIAVNHATLAWARGQIHALVGQNGAGKSTLARVIAGLQIAERGEIFVAGNEIRCGDHVQARRAGIDMVHQHSSLVPTMTVAEALEVTETRGVQLSRYRRRTLHRKWAARLGQANVDIDVGTVVGDLSVEAVQSLEIARANPGPGGVLVLDEPTAVLPPPAIEQLFMMLRELRSHGITIIIVLHKLAEVRAIADTVSVLRRGRVTLGTAPIDTISDREMSEHIIGAVIDDNSRSDAPANVPTISDQPIATDEDTVASGAGLALRECTTAGSRHEVPLDRLSLHAQPGEIVGIAGVDGNGQRTVVELLCGVESPATGRVVFADRDITELGVRERRDLGVHVVPFDRFEEGVAAEQSLWRNVTLWNAEEHRRWPKLPFVSTRALRRQAEERLDAFAVVHADTNQDAGTLSGGNIQRLILARELDAAAALVIAQPTRGLDIGGISFVWQSVSELAASGVPIVVVSSDLDELLEHCDRLYVVRGGRTVMEAARPFHRGRIGAAMTGGEV
ncbi:MAG: ATP-binding cassette domain-containing protein [Actinomycetota bacterium]